MVEMLGVLAVMGLLTIIGIAGFKMAINKAKANNLVADMNRLAHIVVMDKFSGYSEEAIQRAVEEHNQKTEYQAEYEYRTPQVFAIKTKNPIDKTLCQQVANLGWQLPLATYLNKVKVEGTFDADSCTDENELIWAFTNDLSACPDCPLGDFDCTPYANRECGTCDSIGYTPKNEDCANNANGQYCVNGKCQECDVDQFWFTDIQDCMNCVDDDTDTDYHTTLAHKHDCLGKMVFYKYTSGSHRLFSCHFPGTVKRYADETSCKACLNRCYDNGNCYLVGDDQTYARNEDGSCFCKHCQPCPSQKFWSTDALKCIDCIDDATNTAYYTTEEHKHDCLGKMFFYKYSGGGNRLYSCYHSKTIKNYNDETSCKACPNRCYLNGTCYLAGEGQTYSRVSDDDGTCVANSN